MRSDLLEEDACEIYKWVVTGCSQEISGLQFYNQRESVEGEKTTLFLIPE